MNRPILYIVLILCVVQIDDAKPTEIFKDAFNSVKNTAKSAVHSVKRFFLPNHHHHHHHHHEDNTEIEIIPTTSKYPNKIFGTILRNYRVIEIFI